MTLAPSVIDWIKRDIASLDRECEDLEDALQYADDQIEVCIEDNNLGDDPNLRGEIKRAYRRYLQEYFAKKAILTDEEWETFFELVDKIVDAESTAQEKKAQVLKKCEENSSEINFEELVSWFEDVDF